MSLALEQTNLIQKKITQETPIPKHIAIIMDGNRRWQKKHACFCQKHAISGHRRGADSIPQVVDTALHLGVEAICFFYREFFPIANRSRRVIFVIQFTTA